MKDFAIAIAASSSLRSGPDSPFIRLVRDFENFFLARKLLATEGTYNAIRRCGLLLRHPNFIKLPPGIKGGVVEIASLVVNANIDAVAFFTDPRTSNSVFPEIDALKRMSVDKQILFFGTTRSLYEWAALTWEDENGELIAPDRLQRLRIAFPIENQTIALIAHDSRKMEMINFAIKYKEFLLKFNRVIATGTTGTLLSGTKPSKGNRSNDEWAAVEKAYDVVVRGGLKLTKVDQKFSGPRGGDIAIAQEVLQGNCQKVVFFEDPLVPHPHLADIKLLERTCCIKGKRIVCISDPASADAWAASWQSESGFRNIVPETLSTVISTLLQIKIKIILTESYEGNPTKTMQAISRQAAWYLYSWIFYRVRNATAPFNRIVCALPWGTTIANSLEDLEGILKDQVPAFPKVFPQLTTVPTNGIIGHTNPCYEANDNAKHAANILGGEFLSISQTAYVIDDYSYDVISEQVRRHYQQCELVFMVAAPMSTKRKGFGGPFSSAALGSQLIGDVIGRGAIGETNGIFLNPEGTEIRPNKFQRVGISWDDLESIRKREGSSVVLLAGGSLEYLDIALACLRSGKVTTLISDRGFLLKLLEKLESELVFVK